MRRIVNFLCQLLQQKLYLARVSQKQPIIWSFAHAIPGNVLFYGFLAAYAFGRLLVFIRHFEEGRAVFFEETLCDEVDLLVVGQ